VISPKIKKITITINPELNILYLNGYGVESNTQPVKKLGRDIILYPIENSSSKIIYTGIPITIKPKYQFKNFTFTIKATVSRITSPNEIITKYFTFSINSKGISVTTSSNPKPYNETISFKLVGSNTLKIESSKKNIYATIYGTLPVAFEPRSLIYTNSHNILIILVNTSKGYILLPLNLTMITKNLLYGSMPVLRKLLIFANIYMNGTTKIDYYVGFDSEQLHDIFATFNIPNTTVKNVFINGKTLNLVGQKIELTPFKDISVLTTKPVNITLELKDGKRISKSFLVNTSYVNEVLAIINRIKSSISYTNGTLTVSNVTEIEGNIKCLSAYINGTKITNRTELNILAEIIPLILTKNGVALYNITKIPLNVIELEDMITNKKPSTVLKPGTIYVIMNNGVTPHTTSFAFIFKLTGPVTYLLSLINVNGAILQNSSIEEVGKIFREPVSQITAQAIVLTGKYKLLGVDTVGVLTASNFESKVTQEFPVLVNVILPFKDKRFRPPKTPLVYNVHMRIKNKTKELLLNTDYIVGDTQNMTEILYNITSGRLDPINLDRTATLSIAYMMFTAMSSISDYIMNCYYPKTEGTGNPDWPHYIFITNVSNIHTFNSTLPGTNIKVPFIQLTFELPKNETGKVFIVSPYYYVNGRKYIAITVTNATKINATDVPFVIFRINSTSHSP